MSDATHEPADAAVQRKVEYLLGPALSRRWNADQQLAWAGTMEIARLLPVMHDREMKARHGLGLTLLSLLGRLDDCEGRTLRARELAIDLDLSAGRVSRHLASLEAAGLLRRTHSEHDGRALDVELTDTGRARLAEARQTAHDIVERDFLSRMTASETASLAQVVTQILRAAGARDGADDDKEPPPRA